MRRIVAGLTAAQTAEWVRFVEPHLPDALRQSPTHVIGLQEEFRTMNPSFIRCEYVLRLIRDYPAQYTAFVTKLRISGRL